jgi:hypothetical protein
VRGAVLTNVTIEFEGQRKGVWPRFSLFEVFEPLVFQRNADWKGDLNCSGATWQIEMFVGSHRHLYSQWCTTGQTSFSARLVEDWYSDTPAS